MPGELDGPRSFTAGPIWALIQVSDPPWGLLSLYMLPSGRPEWGASETNSDPLGLLDSDSQGTFLSFLRYSVTLDTDVPMEPPPH